MFCEQCGLELIKINVSDATLPTRTMPGDVEEASAKGFWGEADFKPGSPIVLQIRDKEEPIVINAAPRIVFGRADEHSQSVPDVDLSPYGALEYGVSRQHAALEVNEDILIILDVGSANGTFLNGQRLVPNQPRVLRNGDEVRLGKLVTYIYFK